MESTERKELCLRASVLLRSRAQRKGLGRTGEGVISPEGQRGLDSGRDFRAGVSHGGSQAVAETESGLWEAVKEAVL